MAAPTSTAAPTAVTRRSKMRYVQFGTTDMLVSECCAGTMMWGSFVEDKASAHAQLDALFEAGVNFIDTAEVGRRSRFIPYTA